MLFILIELLCCTLFFISLQYKLILYKYDTIKN